MKLKVRWAHRVSALLLAAGLPWHFAIAQDGASLEEKIGAQYKLTRTGTDASGPVVLEAGVVLVIKKTGILGVPYGNVAAGQHIYKDGALRGPNKLAVGLLGKNTRYLQVGDKVYIRKLEINPKSDKITFVIFECDKCNGVTEWTSYRAEVIFEFGKAYLGSASLPQVTDVIDQVLSIDKSAAPGITESRPQSPAPPVALKLPATYAKAQGAAGDQLQLNTDNSFALQEAGQAYHGTFTADGSTLELNISEGNVKSKVTIQGNNLIDSSQQTWVPREQTATSSAPVSGVLHNQDIILLAKTGIDDGTIVAKIGSSKCQFDTSVDALIQLKTAGVSAAVLKAMVDAGK